MNIRSKLAWTFILLLIFGITAISSYSILFIRDYLLEEGVEEMAGDTRHLAVAISNLSSDDAFSTRFEQVARTSEYRLALYDSTGRSIAVYPDSLAEMIDRSLPDSIMARLSGSMAEPWMINRPESERLISYFWLPDSRNNARIIRVSQFKDRIFEPIKTIRWIIYYGMFISIGLVILVSIWIARYLTRPITQIKNAARKIAEGDVEQQIDLKRSDEFGALSDSLNRMASKLRADTEQIKRYAEKQRQFFADITHEIRNPLHTISGALEMLEMEEISEEKRHKYLASARKQTERLSRLFQDLMTLQRFDSGEYLIEEKNFDLSEISRHLLDWYQEQAEEKGIDLHVDTHACPVKADPGKIEQVVDNLVSNAIKYTNEGEVRLTYNNEGNRVKVEVRDSGIGISEEHLDRLFDRFYRTDKARSRDKGGIGLGLSVVRSILEAHGTEIEVESETGRGTVFRFDLPAADPD